MLVNLHKDWKKCKAEKQRQKFILRDNETEMTSSSAAGAKSSGKKLPSPSTRSSSHMRPAEMNIRLIP